MIKKMKKYLPKEEQKALIDTQYEFNSRNVFLDKILKEIKSDQKSSIKDDNSNLYNLSKFIYYYEKKLLKGNDIEVNANHDKKIMINFILKMLSLIFQTILM